MRPLSRAFVVLAILIAGYGLFLLLGPEPLRTLRGGSDLEEAAGKPAATEVQGRSNAQPSSAIRTHP